MSEDIDNLLLKFRSKWHLSSLAWISYEDISQIIRLHIYNKWHLWDQNRSFAPWCNRLINNQILNLIRNYYGNYAKPCLRCEHYGGNEECHLTNTKNTDSNCSLYAKWEIKKKNAYHLKLPESIDNLEPYQEPQKENQEIDYEKSQWLLHDKMKKKLSKSDWKIYYLCYVENKSDEFVAKKLGYGREINKKTGNYIYKDLNKFRKKFTTIARKILQDHDIIK